MRGHRPDIVRRVQELEEYCYGDGDDALSLEGLQERVRGIPPGAVRGSDFLHRACDNGSVTLEIVECLLDAFPDAVRSVDELGYVPLHRACMNGRVSFEMIERLLDAFPEAARSIDDHGWSPLHRACWNENIDPGIVRTLLDSWPESVNHRAEAGCLPVHVLCDYTGSADETASLAVLELLLAAAPDSATLANGGGDLPIHLASWNGKSYPFCKRFIDAYPASLMLQSGEGCLPIHLACRGGINVETVKCLIELYPESIDVRDGDGDLPIHCAVISRGQGKVDIIRYLLIKDPACASKTGSGGCLPLHRACEITCLDAVCLLFDAYPEAINIEDEVGRTPIDLVEVDAASGLEVRRFMEDQLAYARLAEGATHDGWLLLHALRNGASLGAIKLLIAGNRDALQAANQSASPLHIACEYSTAGIVNYLLERGVYSVSVPNSNGKLPIHLLWESDRVDRNSVEYVEAVWRLLLAHPEPVMH